VLVAVGKEELAGPFDTRVQLAELVDLTLPAGPQKTQHFVLVDQLFARLESERVDLFGVGLALGHRSVVTHQGLAANGQCNESDRPSTGSTGDCGRKRGRWNGDYQGRRGDL